MDARQVGQLSRRVDAATDPDDPHALVRGEVNEDKDAYSFYLEMPGLKVGSIDVEVEDDMLVVSAERSQVHIAERRYGPIKRAFTLPSNGSVMAYARRILTGYCS